MQKQHYPAQFEQLRNAQTAKNPLLEHLEQDYMLITEQQ